MALNPSKYHELMSCPIKFGQIYAALDINQDCEVLCKLFVQQFNGLDWRTNKLSFDWVVLGESKLVYENPLSKAALAEDDNKALTALRDAVRKLPERISKCLFNPHASVTTIEESIKLEGGCFDTELYRKLFGVHAICKIVRNNTPPSAIICALKRGTRKAGKRDGLLICFDQKLDLVLVLQQSTGKVLNIGSFSEMESLDQPKAKKKTIEQLIGEAVPEERDNKRARDSKAEIFGKHEGDLGAALEDFYSLGPVNVSNRSSGAKIGQLLSGEWINIHTSSSDKDKRPITERRMDKYSY